MIYCISPTKTMQQDDTLAPVRMPAHTNEATHILSALNALPIKEQQAIWKCSDSLAEAAHMAVEKSAQQLEAGVLLAQGTPAAFAYHGLQFQHLTPEALSDVELTWLDEHLRVISAVFGVVRPLDALVPYRLEMQAAWAPHTEASNMYAWWGTKLADYIVKELEEQAESGEDAALINLASKEYSKALLLKGHALTDACMTIDFKVKTAKGLATRATAAKMARGQFMWWAAHRLPTKVQELKEFSLDGYEFQQDLSDARTMTFVKTH